MNPMRGNSSPKWNFYHLLAQFLLPLDLRQQQFFPVVGTVDVAGPQLGRQAVAFPIEQQERISR